MSLAHPLALLLLLLLIPVGLLYRLRLRVPQATVGTNLFWQKALAEEPRRAAWQRWRTTVSLVIQTLIVILISLAAAGPAIPAARRIVLILDNSATMRAIDVQPTRLDAAKEAAGRMIDSLRWCDEMAIVTTCPLPREVQPLTSNQTLLRSAVDAVQGQPESADNPRALNLADEILSRDQWSGDIVLITDRSGLNNDDKGRYNLSVLHVGTPAANRAISGFTARRSKAAPTECEVFAEVQNCGDQSAAGTLTLSVNGKPGAAAPFAIERDGRWQHLFMVSLPTAATLTAAISPGDDYPFDDAAELRVPAPPSRHRVRLVAGEGTNLKEMLAADPRVELLGDGAGGRTIQVMEGNTPRTLPAGPLLIFMPGPCNLWQCGDAVADPLVTRVDEVSPVTSGVRLFDAYLPESRALKLADPAWRVARPILWAGKTPLGHAIDRPQGRVVVIDGNLALSNLPLQADFPKLVAQALDWLDGQSPRTDEVVEGILECGGLPPLAPSDSRATTSESESKLQPVWKATANRLNPKDIRVPSDAGAFAAAVQRAAPTVPLWIPLAVAAALLLIVEWCLYQRRWTS